MTGIRVLHVIVGLDVGGAELSLKRLIEADPNSIHTMAIVSLTSLGAIGETLRSKGVHVHVLGLKAFLDFPAGFWRLVQIIRQYHPIIVQTWMYHSDLLGGLAARIAGSSCVLWGVRSTSIPQGPLSVTFWLVRICALLSHVVPHKIICNAQSAKAAHLTLGYAAEKMNVIFNGYEFSCFDQERNSRNRVRAELRIPSGDIVIGAVGRFDPLKDYSNFVAAAAILASKIRNVRFLMVGRYLEWSNTSLRRWVESAGLVDRFVLIGEQPDVPSYLAAMDIFCLPSRSEAFPNVVVEAMAMGLPCVVTQAGDAAAIVGSDGFVVPVKDSVALAGALVQMCEMDPGDRNNMGESGARRVRTEYGIERMKQEFEKIYEDAGPR